MPRHPWLSSGFSVLVVAVVTIALHEPPIRSSGSSANASPAAESALDGLDTPTDLASDLPQPREMNPASGPGSPPRLAPVPAAPRPRLAPPEPPEPLLDRDAWWIPNASGADTGPSDTPQVEVNE